MIKERIFADFASKNPVLWGLNDQFIIDDHSNLLDIGTPYYPKTNDFFLAIPSPIDLDDLLEKAREKGIHDYKVVKLLAFISSKTVQKRRLNSNEKEWEYFSKEFVDITSKETEKLFKNFKEVYSFLKENRILTRKPYGEGQSYGYGFARHLRFQRLKIVKFSHNKLTQKITTRFKDTRTKNSVNLLTKGFKREMFGVDYDLCEQQLWEKYHDNFLQNCLGGYDLNDNRNSILKYGAYHQSIVQLVKMLNGEFYFYRKGGTREELAIIEGQKRRNNRIKAAIKRARKKLINATSSEDKSAESSVNKPSAGKIPNKKTRKNNITKKGKLPITTPIGRLYSTFSFLNKECRDNFCYDGEKLVQIDVKNCVAFLLGGYLNIGEFDFSENMLKYVTTNNEYAQFNLDICKDVMRKHGIELIFANEFDILMPISDLEFGTESTIDLNFINWDVDSIILFQKVRPTGLFSLSQTLPKENMMRDSRLLEYNPKLAVNLTEINIGSNIFFPNPIVPLTQHLQKVYVRPKKDFKPDKKSSIKTKKEENLPPSLSSELISYYMFGEFFQQTLQREIASFFQIAKSGKFYEFFIDDFKGKYSPKLWEELYFKRNEKKYSGTAKEDRSLTKDMITAMIYASNENSNYQKAKKTFIKHFPILYSLINELKMDRHKLFSNELFNLEAEIMIDMTAKNLIKKRIICLTVHDCIAVKESDLDEAWKEIENSFIKKLGVAPKLEIENQTQRYEFSSN